MLAIASPLKISILSRTYCAGCSLSLQTAINLLFKTCLLLSTLIGNPGEPKLWLNLAVALARAYQETAGVA